MTKSFTLSKSRLNWLTLLAVVALGISAYQTFHFSQVRSGQAAFHSFCTVGKTFDCNAVDASPYAEIFAGIPLSAAAAGWWLAILAFTLLARSAEFAAVLSPWILAMTAIGAAFSVGYLWIMTTILKVGCLLCLGIDAVNFSALGIGLHAWLKRDRAAAVTLQFKMPAVITAICLFVAVVVARGMLEGLPDSAAIQDRVQSALNAPISPMNITPDLPVLGNPQAAITIVKFSDFQCPSCRIGAQTLHPVLQRYADKVKFVYRNFPLDAHCNRVMTSAMHAHACEMARGAICAQAQGKFEEYYQSTFAHQQSLHAGSALETARELGLDTSKFEGCLADAATNDRVLKDIEEGIALKVESTPTFFINGHKVAGALPPQAWNMIIDSLLRNPQ